MLSSCFARIGLAAIQFHTDRNARVQKIDYRIHLLPPQCTWLAVATYSSSPFTCALSSFQFSVAISSSNSSAFARPARMAALDDSTCWRSSSAMSFWRAASSSALALTDVADAALSCCSFSLLKVLRSFSFSLATSSCASWRADGGRTRVKITGVEHGGRTRGYRAQVKHGGNYSFAGGCQQF